MSLKIDLSIYPPPVQLAVLAILRFEDQIDEMGYDVEYYKEDLPKVVGLALNSYRGHGF